MQDSTTKIPVYLSIRINTHILYIFFFSNFFRCYLLGKGIPYLTIFFEASTISAQSKTKKLRTHDFYEIYLHKKINIAENILQI